jgi:hypothetical protein
MAEAPNTTVGVDVAQLRQLRPQAFEHDIQVTQEKFF